MFQLDDLQACAPESLPCEYNPEGGGLDDSVTIHLSFDTDSMGFHTVTLVSRTREAIIDCLKNFWGDDDATGGWTTEQHDRITKK